MRFLCKHHSSQRPSRSSGLRSVQRVNDLNCEAKVLFYKRANGEIKLTSFSEVHSHRQTEEMYRLDTDKIEEKDKELIKNLIAANCNPQNIQRRLLEQNDTRVNLQAVRYAIKLLDSSDNPEAFNCFLDKQKTEGSSIHYDIYPSGQLRFLSISTRKMKQAYRGADPSVIQCDTTFNFESAGYKLSAIVYLNNVTGKGEVAQLSFHADETSETYQNIFTSFSSVCERPPPIIIVDKDFNEIECLAKVFPNSRILLCTFHVLKYVKGVIATAHGAKFSQIPKKDQTEEKEVIMESFNKLLYARTKAEYDEKKMDWDEAVEGVEVKLGAGEQARFTTLAEYFDECWDDVQEMWARFARATLPMGGDNTNNRIERSFRTMKDTLQIRIRGKANMAKAVPCLVDWAEAQLENRYVEAQCHSVSIADPDTEIAAMYKEAGQELSYKTCLNFKASVDLLRKREDRMTVVEEGVEEVLSKEGDSVVKLYSTTEDSCNCTYYQQQRVPCRHVLLLRRHEGLPLFSKELFQPQDLAGTRHSLLAEEQGQEGEEGSSDQHQPLSVDDVDEQGRRVKVLTAAQKHNIVFPKLQRLSNMLSSSFGQEAFLNYVKELDEVESRVRRGQNIFNDHDLVNECDSDCDAPGNLDEVGDNLEAPDNLDAKGFKIEFMSKVKSRGRPRGTGAPKTSFKRKSSKSLQRKKSKSVKQKLGSDVIDLEKVPEPRSVPDLVLCELGERGEVPCSTRDYLDLQPGSWVGTGLVDFLLQWTQSQLSTELRNSVLLLDTSFFTVISRGEAQGDFTDATRWKNVKEAGLWRSGPKTVVLPVCRAGHWVTLVARLGDRPLMVTLNSIRSGPSAPPEALVFANFLRSLRGWPGLDFTYKSPAVPEQPNWTDCGLFTVKYVEKVLENPDSFLQMMVKPGSPEMLHWFPYSEMSTKRSKIAELIGRLAVEQRRKGEPLQGRPLNIPDIDFEQVTSAFFDTVEMCVDVAV